MTFTSLIYPMFAMVVLTVIVLAKLFRSRVRAVKDGAVKVGFYKTYQGQTEPDTAAKLSRHFSNIFEAPTLFYIVCLAAMITQFTSIVFLGLAWLYVFVRAVHAYVHTGKNHIRNRINIYMMSWAVLIIMWAYLTFYVATNHASFSAMLP